MTMASDGPDDLLHAEGVPALAVLGEVDAVDLGDADAVQGQTRSAGRTGRPRGRRRAARRGRSGPAQHRRARDRARSGRSSRVAPSCTSTIAPAAMPQAMTSMSSSRLRSRAGSRRRIVIACVKFCGSPRSPRSTDGGAGRVLRDGLGRRVDADASPGAGIGQPLDDGAGVAQVVRVDGVFRRSAGCSSADRRPSIVVVS